MILAAYKGTRDGLVDGMYNRLGRRVAHGVYSHTEMYFPESHGESWSSSFMDGGVREKQIGFSTVNAWDFFEIPKSFSTERALDYSREREGWGYDIMGNFRFGIAIAVSTHSKFKEFCSEHNGGQLGLPDTFKLDPCLLVSLVVYLGAKKMDRL